MSTQREKWLVPLASAAIAGLVGYFSGWIALERRLNDYESRVESLELLRDGELLQAVAAVKQLDPEVDWLYRQADHELFWFWTQQLPGAQSAPKGVFYASHEDAKRLPMHQVLPIEPRWIIEALGVVSIDPAANNDGPYPRGADMIEIRTPVPTSQGDLTRSLVIHNRYGWVAEQKLIGPNGQVVAEAKASRHRYYPEHGVTLPEEVHIVLAPDQPQQMTLHIFVGQYLINQLNGDPKLMFEMPQIEGYPSINLAQMLAAPPGSASTRPRPVAPAPMRSPNSDLRTGYRSAPIRGFERR